MILIWFFFLCSYCLEWCQNDIQNDVYQIQCYELEEVNNLQNECQQEIFIIDEDKQLLIFNEEIKRNQIEIQCEKEHEYQLIFFDELQERRINGTVKGVSNCKSHFNDNYCNQCYCGYYLYYYYSYYDYT